MKKTISVFLAVIMVLNMMTIPTYATELDPENMRIITNGEMQVDPRVLSYIDLSLIDYAFSFNFSSSSKSTVTPYYRFRTNSTQMTLKIKCDGTIDVPVTVCFYRSPADLVSRTTITLNEMFYSTIPFPNLSANYDYYFSIENLSEVNTTIYCTVND